MKRAMLSIVLLLGCGMLANAQNKELAQKYAQQRESKEKAMLARVIGFCEMYPVNAEEMQLTEMQSSQIDEIRQDLSEAKKELE